MFSFNMIRGNPQTALARKYAMVLTETTAEKYFGDVNPVGKVIRFNERYNFLVTGVVDDPPANSHISFNLIASFSTLEDFPFSERLTMWGSLNFLAYVRLEDSQDPSFIEQELPAFIAGKMGEDVDTLASHGIEFNPYLQPLTSIHLHSNLLGELQPNGDIHYVYIFSAIAFFLLIIACINFVNLTTARSATRAKEVGMRKTLGANKGDLIIQFLGESLLLSLIALVFSMLIIEFTIPWFNQLTGKSLAFMKSEHWPVVFFFLGFSIFVGVLAGIYPAFYLAAFRPISVLKGHLSNRSGKSMSRNILVVFQFFISVVLIISTTVIIRQFNYLKNLNLGFNKEQVVVVPLRGSDGNINRSVYRNAFLRIPEVQAVSVGSNYPGTQPGKWGCSPESSEGNMQWVLGIVSADVGYFETLGMELIAGRNFIDHPQSDQKAIIINETLLKKAAWENPIGKRIYIGDSEDENRYTVIGVVRDAHFSSLKDPIEPMIFVNNDEERANKLLIKLNAGNLKETLTQLENTWHLLEPGKPFDYFFLNQSYGELLENDARLSMIFSTFTILAIFIACLGLFGLSSFTAEQRIREIGVRKVFGASTTNIIYHLSFRFIGLVLIANILGWLTAHLALREWLKNFAYATNFGPPVFITAGIITFSVALLTVTFIAIWASNTKPMDSLRYE
jgi:putative ABC transport system permease protein